ncbi:hypothetical protein KSC_109990 [Ktedonobacter sp. SOSP1-52]|nr:hypothetical protein KSC_109990 [Ktedonobacter sp. SOSP1-52]
MIGASMGGLLAARVLSDYFEQVTIIERDDLPTVPEARKGVPQGNHVHLLMIKGADIISDLFPGLFDELQADGSLEVSPTQDFHWFHFGCWKQQFPGELRAHSQSRPLLEYHIRRRVSNLGNVRILDGCEVRGLQSTDDSTAITGVRIVQRDNGQTEECLEAQLVIDASGRGSQTPRWLGELGYPAIEETTVKVDVGYATRLYRRPEKNHAWKMLGIYPWPLERKRVGYCFSLEDNMWIVTLSGYHGDHPPADEAGYLEFARNLAQPDIYEAIKDAEPLSPIAIHKFPANRHRHYERLSRLPEGLIVLGDAFCSLNPVYGQGMTLAALEAATLRDSLSRAHGDLAGFPLSFQKKLARVIQIPWMLTTSEDFRYPETEGKRPFGLPVLQAYTQRVSWLTAKDPLATKTFYEVLNMLGSPLELFDLRILRRAVVLQAPPASATTLSS